MTLVRQRADADCGCVALANYSGESYEDCYVAVARVDKRHRGKNGLHNREVIAAARVMGITLTPTRRFDLDEDEGVLRVRWNDDQKRRGGHFVAVVAGKVRCSSGDERDWRDYLALYDGRLGTLLKGAS